MISVVIALYNKGEYIINTINSVLTQSYDDYEIVVVDDGSTDDGWDKVKNIESEKLKLFAQKNKGPAAAKNRGIKESNGEWCIILDADDFLEPGALRHFSDLAQEQPNCEFFCCNFHNMSMGKKTIHSIKIKPGYLVNNFFSWCTGQFLPVAGAAMISRRLWIKYPYNESLKRYEDADCLFKMMRDAKVFISPVPTMTYNHDASAASHARKNISEDFIGHLDPKGKGFWEKYALHQLYCQGLRLYPDDMDRLYGKDTFRGWNYSLAARIIGKLQQYGWV